MSKISSVCLIKLYFTVNTTTLFSKLIDSMICSQDRSFRGIVNSSRLRMLAVSQEKRESDWRRNDIRPCVHGLDLPSATVQSLQLPGTGHAATLQRGTLIFWQGCPCFNSSPDHLFNRDRFINYSQFFLGKKALSNIWKL